MAPNMQGPVSSRQLGAPGLSSLAQAGLEAVASKLRPLSPGLLEAAASYSASRTGLRAAEAVLSGAAARAPTGLAATKLGDLARAARTARRAGARTARESGAGHWLPGWFLNTVNAFLMPVVGIELRPLKHVSTEEELENTDEDTTEEETTEEESCVESDDKIEAAKELEEEELAIEHVFPCEEELEETKEEEAGVESEDGMEAVKDLSDEELAKYVEEEDDNVGPTANEMAKTEAEQAMEEIEIIADRKSPCFENKNVEEIIEFVNRNMLEDDYLPEKLGEGAVQSDPEGELLTEAELEVAEIERLEAAEYEEELELSSYSCPVPQCDMAPIDLSQMMAGTAISHLVSEHGLPEGEITKAQFHFKKEPGAEYEEWYDEQLSNECKHQVADEVVYLSGHCLPMLLPGSAAKVVKVKEEPEDENIILEHKDDICFNGEVCQHQNCDVLYDGGHCLPKHVKVEPEEVVAPETKSDQVENFANRSAEVCRSAEEILAVRTMDLQAMLGKDDTTIPTSMELFIAEMVETASVAVADMAVEVDASFAGVDANKLVDTAGSIELGASCTGTDINSLLGATDPEAAAVAIAVAPGLSCTGGDINSLLSQMESMGFENLS